MSVRQRSFSQSSYSSDSDSSNSSNSRSDCSQKLAKGQVLTDYPYILEQIQSMYKQEGGQVLSQLKAKELIKKQLNKMSKYNYRIKHEHLKFQDYNITKQKQLPRSLYIKFICQRCKPNSKNQKVWTSHHGYAELNYIISTWKQVKKLYPKLIASQVLAGKTNFTVILWQLIIYKQKCMKCKENGRPLIYKTQINALGLNFCWVIAQKLANAKHIETQIKSQKTGKKQPIHVKSLCQACKLGKCLYSRRR